MCLSKVWVKNSLQEVVQIWQFIVISSLNLHRCAVHAQNSCMQHLTLENGA